MIKVLKLQKAVIAIILGVVALIIAQIMSSKHVAGSNYALAISGCFLIIGALIFLYPILFAKKVDNEETKVELKPAAKEPVIDENI
jgi:membrane protein CcdC involved in cytochrome C biogenesis